MRTSLHDLWGCGRGPLRRSAPHTRMIAAALVFAACMVCSGTTLSGSAFAGGMVVAWLLACRPPGRVLRASVALALLLLLPYFFLLPILPGQSGSANDAWGRALVVPWTILLRGITTTLISVAAVTCLSAAELREGLLRLPVPSVVSAILVQIVHQTGTLFYETQRVAAAMGVRGAASGGRVAWRVLFSLPQVWFPRVIDRAERVSAAMELRGYCEGPSAAEHRQRLGLADLAALGGASAALVAAIGIRLWGGA